MPAALPDRSCLWKIARAAWRISLAALLLALPIAAATAQQEAFLHIETGVHEAAVNHIARLADGSLITVSDDTTARLWSPDRLEPRGVLLPPVGRGDSGALYAVATSAKAIAIGGRIRDASGLYAVSMYTQVPLAAAGLIKMLPAPVTALCFSPSGKALAIGLQAGGVRVVTVGSSQILLNDTHYDHAVTGLSFDPGGRLLVAADDATLRVYDADMSGHMTPVALPAGANGFSVAVSMDGRHIAVGDRRRAVVHLVDADRLRSEAELQGGADRAGNLTIVAFGLDGRTLFAGGAYIDATRTLYVRRWTLPDFAATDLPVSRDMISDLLPLASGVAFTTAEPSVGRIAADGQVTTLVRSRHIDFRNAGRSAFQLSADGARVRLPIAVSAGPSDVMPSERTIVVDVRDRRLESLAGPAAAGLPQVSGVAAETSTAAPLSPPYAVAGGLGVTEWQNSRAARLNGQLINLQDAETVRAVAVEQNGTGAAIGTDFYVRFVTRAGEKWKQPTGSPAWAVNVSADGRWVVAGLSDGTVRWYQAENGNPGVALFVDPPTQRFVIWTPDGFFDHDHRPGSGQDGRGLIGYRVNLPNGRASAFVAIGQLYPRFFRPDLVGLTFRGDEWARQIMAGQFTRSGTTASTLAEGLPPAVTLLQACAVSPDGPPAGCDGQTPVTLDTSGATSAIVPADRLRLRYRLTDPSGHVGAVVVRRDEAVLRPDILVESTSDTARVEQVTLSLGRSSTVVSLAPVNATGGVEAGPSDQVTLKVERGGVTRGLPADLPGGVPVVRLNAPTPRLYVLSVGVNKSGNPGSTLTNAVNDAQAIGQLMATPAPGVYDRPDVITLVDPNSTRSSILAALRHIAENATPDDLVMIFLAGHGQTVEGQYYFSPYDLGRHDAALVDRVRAIIHDKSAPDAEYRRAVDKLFTAEGLSQDQLLAAVQAIQAGRIALVLDTCYSATLADQDAVLRRDANDTVTDRIGHASGRFVLSGTVTLAYDATTQTSVPEEGGHGLFTSFVLKALGGAADYDGSGRIDIYKLATYTKLQVARESVNWPNGIQQPAYFFAGNDFFSLR